MRGETKYGGKGAQEIQFQSTLPMRGETDFYRQQSEFVRISIHSPHAGRDKTPVIKNFLSQSISIHSPHAGRDAYLWQSCARDSISIHSPHAGRDSADKTCSACQSHFNPLSPCGERQMIFKAVHAVSRISIHSPHAGRDVPEIFR